MATAVIPTPSESVYHQFVEALALGQESKILTQNVIRAARYAVDHGFLNTAKVALDELAARRDDP